MCQLSCRLNVKNVKEREAKLARLGQVIEERHQQNTKLLKVSCILAAKRPHMVHNAVRMQNVHNGMIQRPYIVYIDTNVLHNCMNHVFDSVQEVEQVKSKLDVTAPSSSPTKKSESPHARRMCNLATQRQLRDIAAMQQERMGQLQAEIENLHKRSYPSFAQRTINYPDEIDRIL